MNQLNQTAATFFGQPLQQVLGRAPEDCCPPAMAVALREWLRAAATAGQASQHEWRGAEHERPAAGR